MSKASSPAERGLKKTTILVLSIFALAGLLLILLSVFLLYAHKWEYMKELFKELGIVLLSVFSVSLIYELFLAERYIQKFHTLLRNEIQHAETIAGACARMGVSHIFPSREDFEKEYPLADLVAGKNACSEIRMIGTSLFHVMNKSDCLKKALHAGAKLDLCLFDSDKFSYLSPKLPDLENSDIHSAIGTFKKNFVTWIEGAKPSGQIELRYHDAYLFQSLARFKLSDRDFGVWDLSFGRDIREKRVFLVDPTWGLGKDLAKRFDSIWNSSPIIFKYENGQITVAKL